jgi:DNA replicative helicase MCM subunit Mcm2 (Cdc46/Mcm family)
MPQDKTKIKDLLPNKIGRLVSISGLPIRLSDIFP